MNIERSTKAKATLAVLTAALWTMAMAATVASAGTGQAALSQQQLMDRVHSYEGLDASQREAMQANLEACLGAGASAEQLGPMFPELREGRELDAPAMLRMQERVRNLLGDGLDPGLVLHKMREGEVKGIPSARLEPVVGRMESDLRRAHDYIGGMGEHDGEMDTRHRQMLERHLAMNMWSGLKEGDLDQLRDRARLRDGSCDPSDLVSAGDVYSMATQRGMDHHEALDLVGSALESGYTHRDMRMLGGMMAAAEMDEFGDRVREHLHEGMGEHRDFADMAQEMMSWGWMGPADMDHAGGWHGMMDDWLGGGPGDHDGMMGDHDHMGGDGGGMGGDGGGMGGH